MKTLNQSLMFFVGAWAMALALPRRLALAAALCGALPLASMAAEPAAVAAKPARLATSEVGSSIRADMQSVDGVVEPVRQATLAAQVAGAIVRIAVQVGDRVRAGQELIRIDAHAAAQVVQSNAAQVDAARANLAVAAKELERQQTLVQQRYISQAALERSQAQFEAAQAQVQALQAQTNAVQTQQGFYVISAPFSGIVSELSVTLGDMAMPGRPLVTVYDPAQLRVTAAVPQSAMPASLEGAQFELPASTEAKGMLAVRSLTVLPQIDAATHSAQIRFPLPATTGALPGSFVRVWLPAPRAVAASAERLFVPASAVLRRAELTAVYLVDAQGHPTLRQVRLGRKQGERVEVLSGLRVGDSVATDPQAAARVN
jgi:RND family efflux transporter MFP subunit